MGVIVLLAVIPFVYGAPIDSNNSVGETCSNENLISKIKVEFEKSIPGLKQLGNLPVFAATSCQQIKELKPEAMSDFYWIQGSSGPSRVYCLMDGESCGEGVWLRVADVNMTIQGATCPNGLETILSPKKLCRKNVDSGCSTVKFPTFEIPYTKVCGQVIGYQFSSSDAFGPYHGNPTQTIDDIYLDGVSLTYSSNPRQHIWTFAVAAHEAPSGTQSSCPCCYAKSYFPFAGSIPEFIGNDYFCETGSRTAVASQYYLDDPLWDGKGCGRFSTCCDGDNKPWFIKNLNEKAISDLEFRLCCNEGRSNEDVLIEIVTLYVQ